MRKVRAKVNAYNVQRYKGAISARMADMPNGDGLSTSSSSGIIRDGDNVVMDANGFKTLITIRKGRCVVITRNLSTQ